MKRFLTIQLLVTFACAALLFCFGSAAEARIFTVGGLVMTVNTAVHVLVWPRILMKKQVALSIGIIVIKFLILGWILYDITTRVCAGDLRLQAWFAAGLSTIVISVFTAAIGEWFRPTTSEMQTSCS